MASGLSFATAGATGESTAAVLTSPLSGSSSIFTWSYVFSQNGGHELSNIAIAFCSTDVLAHVVSASPAATIHGTGDVPGGHAGFGPGVKFDITAVNGTLTVVFDQPMAAGGSIKVQSHSGDGSIGDLVTTAAGPGNCATTTTVTPSTMPGSTTTTVPTTTTTVGPTTTTTVAPTTTVVPTTTTTVRATTTTVAPTTTTAPAPTTTIAPAPTTTVVAPSTTVPPPPTTVVATTTTALASATTSTSVPTSVLGARFDRSDHTADLAKTGLAGTPLVAFGALLIVFGAVVMVGSRLEPSAR